MKKLNINKNEYINKKIKIISGPTYATASPHLGTILNLLYKDLIQWINNVFNVSHKKTFAHGFDCHGAPIYNSVLKTKFNNNISKIQSINKFKLIEYCNDFADNNILKCKKHFKHFLISSDNEYYSTHSIEFAINELLVYKKLLKNNIIKFDYMLLDFCTYCKSVLSLSEINKAKYISDSHYLLFLISKKDNLFVLIWTSELYSIIFNQAICYNNKIKYLISLYKEKKIIISEKFFLKNKLRYNLRLISYIENNLDFFNNLYYKKIFFANRKNNNNSNKFINHHSISDDIGTGFVHLSLNNSRTDLEILNSYNYNKYEIINFKNEITFYYNEKKYIINFFQINNFILDLYKKHNLFFDIIDYNRSVNKCWRCKNKTIVCTFKQLFIDLQSNNILKDILSTIENNIMFYPNNSGIKYFFSSRKIDWCISRQRLNGLFIPFLICSKCGRHSIKTNFVDIYIKQLKKTKNIHSWLNIDKKYFNFNCVECKNKNFILSNETFDVWFDSACVKNFFDKKNKNNKTNCSTLFLEGVDQDKAWFHVSLIIDYFLKKTKCSSDINTILKHGYILDKNFNKLSKSKNNFASLEDVLNIASVEQIKFSLLKQKFGDDIVLNWLDKKQLTQVKNLLELLDMKLTQLQCMISYYDSSIEKSKKIIELKLYSKIFSVNTKEFIKNKISFFLKDEFLSSIKKINLFSIIGNLTLSISLLNIFFNYEFQNLIFELQNHLINYKKKINNIEFWLFYYNKEFLHYVSKLQNIYNIITKKYSLDSKNLNYYNMIFQYDKKFYFLSGRKIFFKDILEYKYYKYIISFYFSILLFLCKKRNTISLIYNIPFINIKELLNFYKKKISFLKNNSFYLNFIFDIKIKLNFSNIFSYIKNSDFVRIKTIIYNIEKKIFIKYTKYLSKIKFLFFKSISSKMKNLLFKKI